MDKACTLAAQHLLVQHIGSTSLGDVLDEHVLLDHLFAIGNDGSSQSTCSAFTYETDVQIAECLASLEGYVDKIEAATGMLLHLKTEVVVSSDRHIEEQRNVKHGILL